MFWWQYLLIAVAGVFVGFINTLAGSGSLIALPLLIFFGLDPNTANGTNRLAITMQSISAVSGYAKKKVFNLKEGFSYGLPTTLGAIIGAFIAVEINSNILNYIIAGLLVFMVILMLLNPDRWIKPKENFEQKNKLVIFLLYFAIGIYAGFIQASVGFFLLAALVLASGLELVKANALKNFIVMLYIPITLIIFALNNQVNYEMGLIMGIGSIVGARIAVKLSIKKGANFIRYFMLFAILISALKLLFF